MKEGVELYTYPEPIGEQLRHKLLSRKFWAWVAAVGAAIAGAASGSLAVGHAIELIVAASATYQLAEGIADHGSHA